MCRAIRVVDSPPIRWVHSSAISAPVRGLCLGLYLRFTAHLLPPGNLAWFQMRCCIDPLSPLADRALHQRSMHAFGAERLKFGLLANGADDLRFTSEP